jgi:hypothetical protein
MKQIAIQEGAENERFNSPEVIFIKALIESAINDYICPEFYFYRRSRRRSDPVLKRRWGSGWYKRARSRIQTEAYRYLFSPDGIESICLSNHISDERFLKKVRRMAVELAISHNIEGTKNVKNIT